jgi:hypothetical protein
LGGIADESAVPLLPSKTLLPFANMILDDPHADRLDRFHLSWNFRDNTGDDTLAKYMEISKCL